MPRAPTFAATRRCRLSGSGTILRDTGSRHHRDRVRITVRVIVKATGLGVRCWPDGSINRISSDQLVAARGADTRKTGAGQLLNAVLPLHQAAALMGWPVRQAVQVMEQNGTKSDSIGDANFGNLNQANH